MDIVICHGPNDDNILDLNLKHNKKNIIHRNIYIITYDPNLKRDDCIIIHESALPFKDKISEMFPNEKKRHGWYFQQLIKLYAKDIISDLSEYYLTIDCDTMFIKPTLFFEENIPLYNFVTASVHKPYFEHMKRLHKDLKQVSNVSGISHHMIFNKNYLNDMFSKFENEYNENNCTNLEFWEIFLYCIDKKEFSGSGASEYELYFNYIQLYYPGKYKLRKITWDERLSTIKDINDYNCKNSQHNYISCHHWRGGR
jgi:hypothetical protein